MACQEWAICFVSCSSSASTLVRSRCQAPTMMESRVLSESGRFVKLLRCPGVVGCVVEERRSSGTAEQRNSAGASNGVAYVRTSQRVEATQNGNRLACELVCPAPFVTNSCETHKIALFCKTLVGLDMKCKGERQVTWGAGRCGLVCVGFAGRIPDDGPRNFRRHGCLGAYRPTTGSCAELPRFADLQASRLGALSVMVQPVCRLHCMFGNLGPRLAWHIARAVDGRVFRFGISCTTSRL